MIVKPSNLASSRREFLLNILPAGSLLCLGCGNLSAIASRQNTKKTDEKKHKFLEDSGLTMREAFRFAYLWTYIPMMQAMADKVGREKLVEMIKEATASFWTQRTRSFAQGLPKKDFEAFLSWDYLDPTLDNTEHRKHFWSLAYTTQTVENTPKSYEMKVNECLWAQIFREAKAGDIGFASFCYADEAIAAAFDERIKLTRTKALMKGDDCCHFRWVWEG
jgi:L-2-amino-thiazoline-4-carboxylic acid hydrolase